ncbi:MAG: ABC transporter permease [Coriobacteriales bacterium]|jgi:hypothetical protein|nr:ABC transporter permease [Coriobacteriales bacterium]
MKFLTLYLSNLKVAARSIIILLAALLVLTALVLASLPQELFSKNDVPKVSVAVVYGDGTRNDSLIRNLNAEISKLETVESITVTTLDDAEEMLRRGEVDTILLLPENTLKVLVYGGHATITVRATDPLVGAVVYSVTDRAIEALDRIQNYALVYQQETRGHFESSKKHAEAVNNFSLVLLSEALMRADNVETPSVAPAYLVQLLTLLLFLSVSIASFFVAVIASRQYATGYVRHLYTKGVRYRHLFVSYLLVAASISLVLAGVLAVVLSFVAQGIAVPALLVSSVLLSLVLTALYLMFSGVRQQPQAATTRTLIACLSLMFFLLFIGGGFYPTGLMYSDIRLFNPTWLSTQLANWSLGGALDPVQLALFVVPFAVAGGVGFLMWRRSL